MQTFIQYLIETKLARGHKTWFDELVSDAQVTLRSTSFDPAVVNQMVEWARVNRKTLNHMYVALKDNYREVTDYEVDPNSSPEEKLDHWMGQMDYRDLPIFNELAKRHDKDDVAHVARTMIDVIVDEVRNVR